MLVGRSISVLVTDAGDRKAVAAVRALGRRGVEVWAAGDRRLDHALFSRCCSHRFIYPRPPDDFSRFEQFLSAFLRQGLCDVFLPMSDHTTAFASKHRDELAGCVAMAVPDYETLRTANHKPSLLEIAREMGVEVPMTLCPRDAAELEGRIHEVGYPCVLKPRRGAGAVGVSYPASPEELLARWQCPGLPSDAVFEYTRPMVQEYIPGEIHDVCALFNAGEPVAALTQRRLKTFPASGGRSAMCETTDRPDLVRIAISLLRRLRWHGPANVEFKVHSGDGRPRLMEINARFWGTLGAAIQAGIDFPWLACRLALGQDVEPVFAYEVGLRYRWIVPEQIGHVITSGHKLRQLIELLVFDAKVRSEIRLSDPWPLLARAAACARRFCGSPSDSNYVQPRIPGL